MICGLDEAGKGPVIGPMVIAGVCYKEDKEDVLKNYIKRDSKGYTPLMRNKLYNIAVKYLDYIKVIIIPAGEINSWMREGGKINRLEVIKFAWIIDDIVRVYGSNEITIYIDSPDIKPLRARLQILTLLGNYREKIRDKIVCEHKADVKYLPASIASIIAKVTRDREIARLHRLLGDFGSGYPSDPKTKQFIKSLKGKDLSKYYEYIRLYWKTIHIE